MEEMKSEKFRDGLHVSLYESLNYILEQPLEVELRKPWSKKG